MRPGIALGCLAVALACARATSPGTPEQLPDSGGSGIPDAGQPEDDGANGSSDSRGDESPWPQPIAGSEGEWVPVGPGGGPVSTVVIDPFRPNVALAAAPSGLFRTTNGGMRWQQVGPRDLYFRSVVFAPTESGRVYGLVSESRLFFSSDAGATWSSSSDSLAKTLARPWNTGTLVVDPVSATTLYAATGEGLFRSTDAGDTWSLLWVPPSAGPRRPGVCGVAVDPSAPQILYTGPCGENDPTGVYKSTDGGASWIWLKTFRTAFGGVTAIAIDPRDPATVYAGLDYGGDVIVSNDRGTTWSRPKGPTVPRSPIALAFDPRHPGTVWASLWFDGLHVTRDGGASWHLAMPGLPTEVSTWLALDPRSGAPKLLAVSDFFGLGVYRPDAAGTWRISSAGLFAEYIGGLAWDPPRRRLLASTGSGLFASEDGGASWSAVDAFANRRVDWVAPDPSDSGTMYAATSTEFLRSVDGGQTWTAVGPRRWGRLLIDPARYGRMYAAGGTLARSDDAGAHWTTLLERDVQAFALDPRDPQTLYVWSGGMQRSRDGGTTWSAEGAGLPSGPNVTCRDLVAHPDRPGTLYASIAEFLKPGSLYRSDDAGETWTQVLVREGGIATLSIDARGSGRLYAAVVDAVLASEDDGNNWYVAAAGVRDVSALLPDPRNPDALYAATHGHSVLRAVLRHPKP